MIAIDFTHDPQRESWIDSANEAGTDFPIQNLPFTVFHTGDGDPRIGVGIGDQVLDLRYCAAQGLLDAALVEPAQRQVLNGLMSLEPARRVQLRQAISQWLHVDTSTSQAVLQEGLYPQDAVEFCLPCQIHDYTDFYASIFHATNVGSMFRPNNPLLPNYKHIPIGYHGRASSVVISGTDVVRPVGQKAPAEEGQDPTRSPAALLDYELEVGFYVAQGNPLGSTIPLELAEQHLFGMCLVNDWSARDLQKWEYQPLGPFLAKSFATTVSPWVVTMEALAPFRVPEYQRPDGDPQPLDYLSSPENSASGGVDIQLQVSLLSKQMREKSLPPQSLSQTRFTNMYWTIAQILTHHASNGCNLQPGDLMASGTVSGPERNERGSMLELTWNGDAANPTPGTDRTPLQLPTGEERKFLGDGDELILHGFCENEQYRRIGFGECRGTVQPAR
ncbi:MAG: fumarylacetoacetase [Mariniblastus sp.]|nr:fumarylacetoacetase [Mariniblastus sp.]